MKGDRVSVEVDTGAGTKTFEIVATKAGRRVEVSNARGVVEVAELTRTGNVVRAGRFMSSRVVAIVEYPAEDESEPRAKKKAKASNQSSML